MSQEVTINEEMSANDIYHEAMKVDSVLSFLRDVIRPGENNQTLSLSDDARGGLENILSDASARMGGIQESAIRLSKTAPAE